MLTIHHQGFTAPVQGESFHVESSHRRRSHLCQCHADFLCFLILHKINSIYIEGRLVGFVVVNYFSASHHPRLHVAQHVMTMPQLFMEATHHYYKQPTNLHTNGTTWMKASKVINN